MMMPTSDKRREQARQWVAMIEAAATDFDYPPPPSSVQSVAAAGVYLRQLIAHVESRDLARGFELRVAAKQADWTPDQVQAFAEHMRARPRRDPDQFRKPFNAFKVATLKVTPPIDDAALRSFVDATMQHMINLRLAEPAGAIPLLVGGLTTNAELLTTTVDRDDRIPFITLLARTQPLFGWFVASDMFIHSINVGDHKSATKQDAIGVHFGTRTSRGFLVRPYAVVDGAVQLQPVREDLFTVAGANIDDPYAFVFQPPTTGTPPM